MFQKGSFTAPSDSSGFYLVKVIQARRVSTRRHALIGYFLRVVARQVVIRLVKFRKRRYRAIVVRSQAYFKKQDGMGYSFCNNSLVILKKRMNTLGRELYGPTARALKIRKFRVAFKVVF